MYTRSAPYYDAIYAALGKDYGAEAERVHALIQAHARVPVRRLLDVACGTGGHIGHLRRHYEVEGLDLDPAMLAIARRKHPDVVFHQADMTAFDLGRTFDAIICLFSAIAYAHPFTRLERTLRTFARHLVPGGVTVVEPFIPPEAWEEGHLGAVFVNEPALKVARVNLSRREGNVAVLDFHYLVATREGAEYFTERHDLAMYAAEEYLQAFDAAGLAAIHDPTGLTGRGLFVGCRPVG